MSEPTAAKARPIPRARALAILSDDAQELNLGSHQQRCNSAVFADMRSHKTPWGSTEVHSLLWVNFLVRVGGNYLHPPGTLGQVQAPTGVFPNRESYPCAPRVTGQVYAPDEGPPSRGSYLCPPWTAGAEPVACWQNSQWKKLSVLFWFSRCRFWGPWWNCW